MEFTWSNLVNSLEKEKELVIATILRKRGSAPRGAGTMMLVHKDGSIDGTIGGGPVENDIIKMAQDLIESKSSKIISVNFTGESVICGGNVLVALEYISEDSLNFFKTIAENFNKGIKQILVRNLKNFDNFLFEFSPPQKKIMSLKNIKMDEEIENHIWKIFEGKLKEKYFIKEIEGDEYFFQIIEAVPEIHILGAGHIAVPLYEMAKICQFKIFVYDDREEFAKKERFPDAEKVVLTTMEEVSKNIEFNNSCYFVLVTREHKHDEIVLKQLLGKPYAYIGMIGSKKRVKSVKERIINQGFSKEEVEKIYSPIGLDIGAETPAEIAVSILAEIIQVKNKMV